MLYVLIILGVIVAAMYADYHLNKSKGPYVQYQADDPETPEEESTASDGCDCEDYKELGFCNCNDVEPDSNSCNINDPECTGCDG